MSENMRYEDASDRVITVANAMTAARPPLAFAAMWNLYRGNYKWAAGFATAAAVSDKEGTVGRFIEKRWPGWGISKLGIKGDPLADSGALAITGVGALFHKKVHPVAKAGVGVVIAQEIHKGKWALETTKDYQEQTGKSDIPVVPVTEKGKRATFFKLVAGVGAVATAMMREDSKVRETVAYISLGASVVGAVLGEQALDELQTGYSEMMSEVDTFIPTGVLPTE